MTTLFKTLQDASLAARKARTEPAATLLVTVLAAAVRIGKDDGGREPTEVEVIKTLKSFADGVTESIGYLEASIKADTNADADKAKRLTDLRAEAAILKELVPAQLSDDELTSAIAHIVSELPEKNIKQMGVVMRALEAKHAGLYNGKAASAMVRVALT